MADSFVRRSSEARTLSPRRLIIAALALMLRSFVACSHDVGPGDYCQSGWFSDYDCPPGYVCDDMHGWECVEYRPSDSTPRYPPPRETADASIHESDAGVDEVESDASMSLDASESDS